MVTSLAVPQRAERPTLQQQTAASQISMKSTQQSANMSYQNGLQNTSLAKPYANNPFLSPNTSETWSTDEDSGSSSGQDEFHLERYSQDAAWQADQSRKRRGLGSRSKRVKRPDLNIVTELPGSQARVCGPGIVVEQVKAKKAATTRPKSVVSAKAEHVHDPFPLHRNNALAGLKETARLRHEKNKLQRELDKSNHDHKLPADRITIANTSRAVDRSDQKPVVIGISMPTEEAEAQRHVGDESAITLRTPSIIVTPAAVEAPWSSSSLLSNRQPISSFYSMAPEPAREQHHGGHAPPLPQVPASFNNFSRPHAKSHDQSDDKQSVSSWEGEDSVDGLDEQDVEQPHLKKSRFSSESQERILPSATDPGRPKSQGWWNLALSPMLSRAGTNKSATTRTPGEGDVPPLPSAIDRRRSRSTTLDSQISPETPRRLGLASARASIWSRWTTWEKQKDGPTPASEQDIQKTIQRASRHPVHRSGFNVTALLPPANPNEGLAAEYYRACAIEQLTGESYFECENHSCAEKLPALRSVFDQKVAPEGSWHTRGFDRSVAEGIAPDPAHQSSLSESTNAPDDVSPNVRQADTVSLMKARTIGSESTAVKYQTMPTSEQTNRTRPGEEIDRTPSPTPIPMPSSSKQAARYPNIAAIVPPQHSVHKGALIASPGPISPEMQQTMTSQGAVPMSEMRTGTQPQTQTGMLQPMFHTHVNYPPDGAGRHSPASVRIYNTEYKPSPEISQRPVREEVSREGSKEEAKEKKPGIFSHLKSWAKSRKSNSTASASTPKKRRWAILIGILLLLMIIACVALATQLTRRGDRTPTQQQWLNLTGYPPMPTGISTIIRPDLVKQQDQCVSPNTLWSCSLPTENQAEVAPNDPDQPNFRFEIKFRNGTVPSNMTIPVDSSDKNLKSKRANDPFTNELFMPNPPPPSRAEQIFMGNTTDNVTEPFDGEKTPFFMTFIPAFPIDPNDPSINASTTADLNTRSFNSDSDVILDARQDQNISSAIPAPSTQADGSAAPANLLPTGPYPFAQPIRLYNRGLQDEHYGFYTYYDRSIFSSSTTPLEGTNTNTNTNTSNSKRQTTDSDGGSLLANAKARCTFAQTRFLVRIYTNPSFPATLLFTTLIQNQHNRTTNSATNYTPPGSFPYPTSITLDRHGGNINKKLIYCYGVNELQVIDPDLKSVVAERRGIGGQLVNAAPGLVRFEGEVDEGFDEGAGGIDGGSGGCGCSWQNWN